MNTRLEKKLTTLCMGPKIEEGALTEIYKADYSELLSKTVAVKKMKKEFSHISDYAEILSAEANLLSKLSHPNLPLFLNYFTEEDEAYLVLEYIPGWNLREILNKHRRFKQQIPEWLILWIISTICQTLHYIHHAKTDEGLELEITHGDMNPKNILINQMGHLKLIDFSISQSIYGKLGENNRIGKGSISYMPHEQALHKSMDSRSDLFSLGVMFFELYTGAKPFQGQNKFEVEYNLLNQELSEQNLPEKMDKHLKSTLLKALSKDPSRRFQKASEFEKAVATFMHLKYPGLINDDIAQYLSSLS